MRIIFPALCVALVMGIVSCKKDVETPAPSRAMQVKGGNPVPTPIPTAPPSNQYNSMVESKPAVVTSVPGTINDNIGGYVQALPALYDSTTKSYPVLIFLHGIGELGNGSSDLWLPARLGPIALIRNNQFPSSFTVNGQNFSFIVIAPQFKAWPSSSDINDVVNYVTGKYRVDANRIYLSGLSMGGGATWEYGAAFAQRLAAMVPICGAASPTGSKAEAIAHGGLPVWAFHNDDDYTVASSNSKNWVSDINAYGPSVAARLTLWSTGGHDAWTKATDPGYKEKGMNMYEWMLQYKRN